MQTRDMSNKMPDGVAVVEMKCPRCGRQTAYINGQQIYHLMATGSPCGGISKEEAIHNVMEMTDEERKASLVRQDEDKINHDMGVKQNSGGAAGNSRDVCAFCEKAKRDIYKDIMTAKWFARGHVGICGFCVRLMAEALGIVPGADGKMVATVPPASMQDPNA